MVIFVDVLVLNAARVDEQKSVLETELDVARSMCETNVRTILDLTQRLQN
jgi:NADP-dependent 3-hydroxy acid dehydrogenase YdfG